MIGVPFSKIAVMGGTGFLGRHLVERLRHTSVERIVVVGRGRSNAAWLDPKVRQLSMDWCRSYAVNPMVWKAFAGTDLVINLMAETSNLAFVNRPAIAFNDTVSSTSWLMQFMHCQLQEAGLLHVSSAAVYGSGYGDRVTEELPRGSPATLHGAAKRAQEQLVDVWRDTTGMDAVIAVPCTLFGESQTREKCIPSLVRQIAHRGTVQLGGQGGGMNSSRPELTRRQWLHVEDCAGMLVAILENWKGAQDRYHLAPEEAFSTKEVAELVRDAIEGPEFQYTILQEPPPKLLVPKRILPWVKAPKTRERITAAARELRLRLSDP